MLATMTALLTDPTASALLVLDEAGDATLTEIARATGKPLSTIQRAVDALIAANVIVRETPRGRLRLAPSVPRRAIRELAEWRLGPEGVSRITASVRNSLEPAWANRVPPTIHDAKIRRAWSQAMVQLAAMLGGATSVCSTTQ